MPVPVIDCRTLSVSLTLNHFSHQMKSNYITATRVGWLSVRACVPQDEYLYWSVISFSPLRHYKGAVSETCHNIRPASRACVKYKHNAEGLCNRHTNRQLTHFAVNTKRLHIVFYSHVDRFMCVLVSHSSKTSCLISYCGALRVSCGTWELGPWQWAWGRAPVWIWEVGGTRSNVVAVLCTVLWVTAPLLCDKGHC